MNPSIGEETAMDEPEKKKESIAEVGISGDTFEMVNISGSSSESLTKEPDCAENAAKEQADAFSDNSVDDGEPGADMPVEGDGKVDSSTASAEAKTTSVDVLDDMPVVKNWETSVPFSLLGILGFCALWLVLLAVFTEIVELIFGGAALKLAGLANGGIPASIVMSLLGLFYALAVYPNLFYRWSWLKSNKAISFCNFMFGAAVFCGVGAAFAGNIGSLFVGCLGAIAFGGRWNGNLAESKEKQKRKKGISNKFAMLISTLWIIWAIAVLVASWIPTWSQAKASYDSGSQTSAQAQTASQPSSDAQKSEQALDNIFSIEFPAEPTYESSENGGILTEKYKATSTDCYVLVMVSHGAVNYGEQDPYDFAADITFDFLKSLSSDGTTSFTESDIEKATKDGHPSGYIYLSTQNRDTHAFVNSIIGGDYIINLYIKATSEDGMYKVLDSFSVK